MIVCFRVASFGLLPGSGSRVVGTRGDRPCIFGSALTDRYDPQGSDLDFLVDFAPANTNSFHDYFDLKFELERITGHPVDLVEPSAVRNPYFNATAFASAGDLYAA